MFLLASNFAVCNVAGMEASPKPTQLAELVNISVPYASQILSGSRTPSDAVAVRVFHAFGLKLGRLIKLTDEEVALFAKMQGIEAPAPQQAAA